MVDQGFRLRRPAPAVLGAGIPAALVARSPWVVAAMPEAQDVRVVTVPPATKVQLPGTAVRRPTAARPRLAVWRAMAVRQATAVQWGSRRPWIS
jgi:hypothetical protein